MYDADIIFYSINFHKTKEKFIELDLTELLSCTIFSWLSEPVLTTCGSDTAFVSVFATLEFGTQYIVEWYSVMVYAPKVVHPSEKNQSHQQKCMCTLCKVDL